MECTCTEIRLQYSLTKTPAYKSPQVLYQISAENVNYSDLRRVSRCKALVSVLELEGHSERASPSLSSITTLHSAWRKMDGSCAAESIRMFWSLMLGCWKFFIHLSLLSLLTGSAQCVLSTHLGSKVSNSSEVKTHN